MDSQVGPTTASTANTVATVAPSVAFVIQLADKKEKKIIYDPEKSLLDVLRKLCSDREWKLEDHITYGGSKEPIQDLNIPLKSLGTMEISFLPKARKVKPVEKFHQFVSQGNVTAVADLLSKNEKIINRPGKVKRRTALHLAAESGNKEMTRFLIKHKADLMATDELEWTPLHCASIRGHLDIVEILISKSNDVPTQVKMQTLDGTLCLHYLVRHDNSTKLQNAIDLMLKNGADINAPNKNGDTPLHNAVMKGKPEVVEYLLRRRAIISCKNKQGQTPADVAKLLPTSKRADYVKIFDEWKNSSHSTEKDKEYLSTLNHVSPSSLLSPKEFYNIINSEQKENYDDNDLLYHNSDSFSESESENGKSAPITEIPENAELLDNMRASLAETLYEIYQKFHNENIWFKNDIENIVKQVSRAETAIKELNNKSHNNS